MSEKHAHPIPLNGDWTEKPSIPVVGVLAAQAIVAAGNVFWTTPQWRTGRSLILLSACMLTLFARARLSTDLSNSAHKNEKTARTSRARAPVSSLSVGATAAILILVFLAGELLLSGDGFFSQLRLIVLSVASVLILYDWHRTRLRLLSAMAAQSDDTITARGTLALEALLFQGLMIAACGLAVVATGNALWGNNELWLGARPVGQTMLVFLVLWRLYAGGIIGFVSELSQSAKNERRRLRDEFSRTAMDEQRRLHSLSREWAVEDDSERDRSPLTKTILDALDLSTGMRVADVGTGGGYFALKIAEIVGTQGVVIATDISDGFVARLRQQTQERGLSQLQVKLVDVENPLPVSQQLDRILVANVYLFNTANETEGRALLERFATALQPGGRLVVFNEFVHEEGWLASPEWPPLAAPQPDAATVIEWAAPWCVHVATTPLPPALQERPHPEHAHPGYLIVLERPE